MSEKEQRDFRISKGLCVHCGEVRTHEKKFKFTGPKMVPLDVPGQVVKGECLRCFKEVARPGATDDAESQYSARSRSPLGGVVGGRRVNGPAAVSVSRRSGDCGPAVRHNTYQPSARRSGDTGPAVLRQTRHSGGLSPSVRTEALQTSGGSRPRSGFSASSASSVVSAGGRSVASAKSRDHATRPSRSSSGSLNNAPSSMMSVRSSRSGSGSLREVEENQYSSIISLQSASPPMSNVDIDADLPPRDPDDVTSILEFMRKNPTEDALVHSFEEIGRIASTPVNKDKLFPELQMIIKSIGVVEFHRGNARMLTVACETIYHFANTNNSQRRNRIGAFGGITYTLSFMKAMPNNPSVQLWGSRTLILLEKEEANRDMIIKGGGIDMLKATISHSTMTPEALDCSLRALDKLFEPSSYSPDDRRTNNYVMGDVVTAVANAMQRYKVSVMVVQSGIRFLDKIWDLPTCTGIKSFKPTTRVVSVCMKSHYDDLALQTEALRLLNKIAGQPDTPVGKFVAPKGLAHQLNTILRFGVDDDEDYNNAQNPDALTNLHEEAVRLLHRIIEQNSVCPQDYADKTKCLESTGQVMYNFLSNVDTVRAATTLETCVRVMGLSADTGEIPPNFAVLELVVGVHADNAAIIVAVLTTVPLLVDNNDANAQSMSKARLLPALKEAVDLHAEDDEIVAAACQMIDAIGDLPGASRGLNDSDFARTLTTRLRALLDANAAPGDLVATLSAYRRTLVGDGDRACERFSPTVLRTVCDVMSALATDAAAQHDGCRILRGCLCEDTLATYQSNEDVPTVLFVANEVSDQCSKTSSMILQILFDF